jgi:hypothetical protein
MTNHISRKKLKKKVLDRWENEGGSVHIDAKKLREDEPPLKIEETLSNELGQPRMETRYHGDRRIMETTQLS